MSITPELRDRLARLVRQHAETSKLLGVDFVPAQGGRRGAVSVPAPEPRPAEGKITTRQPEASPAAAAIVEQKPLASGIAAPVPADSSAPVRAASVPVPRDAAMPGARDRDASQARLDALRAKYEADAPHKHFVTSFTNIVFGEGDPCARLMFIGEAPGEEEDRTGRPFVGRAGKLLNDMIAAMGLTREAVYIANVLKTRPPDNATPTLEEARLCAPYLFEQIRIIRPEVIVTLGLPATRLVLGTNEAMGRLRGRWSYFDAGEGLVVPVMPTYHPAYILRNYTPEERGKVWSDLQQVMARLGLLRGAS